MNLRATSAADEDVVAAAVWFEQQRPGLGSDFIADVDAAFEKICQGPRSCPTLHLEGIEFKLDLRWSHIGRFEYLVIFHLASDEAVVVAVLHARRDLEVILRSRVGVR